MHHAYIVLAGSGLLACALCGVSKAADVPDLRPKLEKKVFENAKGETIPYRLFVPKKIESGKKLPLILFLHGAGERGDDNEAQLKHYGVLRFITDDVLAKDPCILVAPQCPKNDKWVPAYFGLKRPLEPPTEETPGGPSRSMRLVMELLDTLDKELPIDPDRRYVTGLSMGGFGSFDLCVRRPDYFAAAVPICGGAKPENASKVAHIPFWIFHGAADPVVPVELSRNFIAALKEAGAKPKYTEYPGVGHNSWTSAYREPGLVDWLLGQRRNETSQ